MKKVLRYLLYSLLGIVGFFVIYFLMAYLLSSIGSSPKKIVCAQQFKGYLSDNGVHVDLILPIETLDSHFIAKLQPAADARYVAIGWGDRGFYLNTPTWDDVRFSTVFHALFLPSPSVMHISFYQNTHPSWVSMQLCPAQATAMQTEIKKWFKTNADGHPQRIEGFDYGQNDRFFEGRGSYHCFRTCNVWTGRILKKGNIKTAIWSPFTGGIMYFAVKNK
jgi:uncharacterized protein (TIGR02117 family)